MARTSRPTTSWRPSTASPIRNGASNALSVFKGLLSKGGTQKVDDHTVAFHLDAPNGSFPYSVSIDNYNAVILPASYKGDYEKTFEGTGPFRLENYTPKVGATFVRNPDYWGEKALPDRLEFKFYGDVQPRILALQAGEVDILDAVPLDVSQVRAEQPRHHRAARRLDRAPPAAYALRHRPVHRQARAPGAGALHRPLQAGRRPVPRHGGDRQ